LLCALALREGFLPGGVGTRTPDPEIGIPYLLQNLDRPPRRILSNSFGFGGSNCSLVLGRAA
ncbi:MAG: beta-ketoacyl-[acyl-carrier-protein] synthase II, partial [Chromatiaceae bacterium]